MDLLLDTCAFIWWDSGGGDLSDAAASALQDHENRLHFSVASIWEMQLKHQKGKLLLRKPLTDIIQEQCAQNGLLLLPIEPGAIYRLGQLPSHHADPFDRLIISQAKLHGYSVVTGDGDFSKYDVTVVW
ncbi:MAG: type II toxin-antitoxin system VapC family toxin [Verrucomicrobiales bacterium]|nr:type II toxin-antitoxin system VapC family toxin [Verrucomicrobiales bacterium]